MPPGATMYASEVSTNWCKPSEKRAVFEGLTDERVYFLFEWQIDSDADRLRLTGRAGRAFVGGLHQAGTTAGNDIAAEFGQCGCRTFCFLVGEAAGFRPGRAKDRHTITIAAGRVAGA